MRVYFLAAVAITLLPTATANIDFSGIDRMIIFGDSLSDAGNTGLVNRYYKQSTLLTELGYPDLPGWTQFPGAAQGDFQDQPRFTNNRMWWDYLGEQIQSGNPNFQAEVVRALPYGPFGEEGSEVFDRFDRDLREGNPTPFAPVNSSQSQNWAWGGAKTMDDSVITDDGLNLALTANTYTIPSVSSQISNYLNSGQNFASSDAVFMLAGANDYLLFSQQTSPIGEVESFFGIEPDAADIPGDFGDSVAQKQVENVQKLIDQGATNIVIMNLPDISDTPAATNGFFDEFSLPPQTFVEQFNASLADGLDSLDLAGVNLRQVDLFSLFKDIVDAPADFDLDPALLYDAEGNFDPQSVFLNAQGIYSQLATEEDDADDFQRWLYWGHIHPAEGGHEAIGTHIFNEAVFFEIPEPAHFALLAGLAALGFSRLRRRPS